MAGDLASNAVVVLSRGSVAAGFAARLMGDAGFAVTWVEPEDEAASGPLFDWLRAGASRVWFDARTVGGVLAGACAIIADDWGAGLLDGSAGAARIVTLGVPESDALLGDAMRDEFLAFHGSGLGYLTPRMMPGYPSAAPLAPHAHMVPFLVGLHGAIAALALLRQAGPARAEIGIAGVVLPLLRREIAAVCYDGVAPHRNERIWRVSPAEVHRCRDGWVFVDVIEDSQWGRLCRFIGRPELAEDARFTTRDGRFDHAEVICGVLDAYYRDRLKSSWREAQAHGVPVAAVNAVADLVTNEQLRARGFWASFRAGDGSRRPGPRTPLARLFGAGSAAGADAPSGRAGLPLAGIRVLELTHVWSGPLCGQILADLGAEVIRVETRDRLDIHRRGGPYPEGRAGIDRSGTWNLQNRGKLGCTLDLKQAEGRRLFLDLVAKSDVVIENFAPGVLGRLDLGLEALASAHARIVLLSLSGFGQDGPDRHSLAYGPMMDAATGLSSLTTYEDGVPRAVNGWAADVGGALYGCAAVIRALLDRERGPLHLDVSQFEAGALFAAEELLRAADGGGEAERRGVRMVAQAREADRWVAISARAAGELAALGRLVGAGSVPGADVRAQVEAWVGARSRDEALASLRQGGVPAGPVATMAELLSDPGLADHGAWLRVRHPEAGEMLCYGPAIHLAGASPNPRPAPCLGEHNDAVFRGILGLSASRCQDLAGRGII